MNVGPVYIYIVNYTVQTVDIRIRNVYEPVEK